MKSQHIKSRYIQTHQPCDDCGSSDAMAIYDDGNTYCFSCSSYHEKGQSMDQTTKSSFLQSKHKVDDLVVGVEFDTSFRSISKSTFNTFGVTRGKDHIYFPYYDYDHNRVANKVRRITSKQFYSQGDFTSATLFGQNICHKGKYITLVEGEMDALSTYQMLGSKWPVCSIKSGAQSAASDVAQHYDYITQFENIVICFDNDEQGKAAAKEVAEMLSPKSRIMYMGLKDANEYLQQNKEKEFQHLWWKSEKYTPEGIVSGEDLWKVVSEGPPRSEIQYPFVGLNKLTYGIRKGELVTIAAGSGLGKSSFMREIVYHVLNQTNDSVGLLFLEESVRRTAQALMGLDMDKPIHLPEEKYTPEELKRAFDNVLGHGRVYFFDHFGSNSIENIIARIRYMARALKCKYIFLDHVSILVSDQANLDERKAIDEIMTKLRTLVQELNISLFVASHLKRADYGHEEGGRTKLSQLRGSASIGQLSDIVLGLERDGQAQDVRERHTTMVRVIKNRFSGLTGPSNKLFYDLKTGRLSEISLGDDELEPE